MTSVLIALGSNVGQRRVHLRRAIDRLCERVTLGRLSRVFETDPVDAPPGSARFLNMVVAGWTSLDAGELLQFLHRIEEGMGRRRRVRNEPRSIDLDLVLHGAHLVRSGAAVVPHPRFRDRRFVLDPLADLGLPWIDPGTGAPLAKLAGPRIARRVGSLYS